MMNDIKQEELFDYSKDPLETENHIGKKVTIIFIMN